MNTNPASSRGPVGHLIDDAHRPCREGLFTHPSPAHSTPSQTGADSQPLASFLREELDARRKRWNRSGRQTLAWVLACSALPILVVVLHRLFFR